jgi:hypothetical protein
MQNFLIQRSPELDQIHLDNFVSCGVFDLLSLKSFLSFYDVDSEDYPKAISEFINDFNNSILEIPSDIHKSALIKNRVKALIDEIVETKSLKKYF